jgi:hypothetical protein
MCDRIPTVGLAKINGSEVFSFISRTPKVLTTGYDLPVPAGRLNLCPLLLVPKVYPTFSMTVWYHIHCSW